MSSAAIRNRGLLTLLAAAGLAGSAAVMWHGPPHTRTPRALLPGFTAEESAGRLVITSVRDGSGAAKAGIAPGDVVETIDGRKVHRLQDAQFLARHSHGVVHVGLVHAAHRHDVAIGHQEGP